MAEKKSVVTAERFAKGLSWAEYLASIQRNRERFEANYEGTTVSAAAEAALKAAAQRSGGPVKVLALGEDWCPDVYRGLGPIVRVAEALGAELRIFPRDSNLDIMDEYLNQGQFQSIPVAVFYDSEMNEIGHWIERPAIANEEHHLVDDIFVESKPREQQRAEYAELQKGPVWAKWRQASVDELVAVATGG